MFDQILIPTDGSDVADAAAGAAIALGRRFDARLHVVHVLEPGERPPGVEDEGAGPLARIGERATRTVAEMAADAGVEATTAIVEERKVPVHHAILDYAEEHDVDCIVMGTYGRTGLGRFVLGSVAERTLRESSMPVLTVHDETVVDPDVDFDAVLVPTDGSEFVGTAVDHAIELARETGAALHTVYVVDLSVVGGEASAGMVLDALEEVGEEALRAVVDRAEAAGVSVVESAVLRGPPHRRIVDYAEEHGIDCVVMGTHGRTGLERYVLGSVTERVVRLTDAPVLTVGGADADAGAGR